ncbi:MAG: hypothetical protein ACFFA4_04970 [Promethearchaeota archaeon]
MAVEEKSETYENLFSLKLRKYEDKLVEFLLDIAESKRVNPKISKISSYLLIHGELTQRELKELTGFSMGSISTFLSVMTGTGTYKKERLPGTHTYVYSFSGKLEDLTTMGLELALNSFNRLQSYFKNKKKELNKLLEQSKKGADHLLQRIDELFEVFEIYKVLFPIITQNKIDKNINVEKPILTRREEKEPKKIQFDAEVYVLEDDILNQFAASPIFSSRDPMFVKILGYFITRKYLTQKKIKNITGLSVGKISEEVNLLLENGLIEKVDISPKGKITYGAESAGVILLKFSRSIINKMAEWDTELQKMKIELENNRTSLEKLKGYSRIYKINDYILDLIMKYKIFIEMADQILNA